MCVSRGCFGVTDTSWLRAEMLAAHGGSYWRIPSNLTKQKNEWTIRPERDVQLMRPSWFAEKQVRTDRPRPQTLDMSRYKEPQRRGKEVLDKRPQRKQSLPMTRFRIHRTKNEDVFHRANGKETKKETDLVKHETRQQIELFRLTKRQRNCYDTNIGEVWLLNVHERSAMREYQS